MTGEQTPPAGWYWDGSVHRWWDGTSWGPTAPPAVAEVADLPPPGGGWPPPPPAARSLGSTGRPRTEPFAIVSLVCSLAGFAVCPPLPGIVGVVFGHVALGRIRRSGDAGRGMAIAGLIVGYVLIALALVAVAIFAALLVSEDRSTDDAVDSARELGSQVQAVARREGIPTRSPRAVRLAIRESDVDPDDVSVGSFGGTASSATREQLTVAGWRLEVESGFSGVACLSVPIETSGTVEVRRDFCPDTADLPIDRSPLAR